MRCLGAGLSVTLARSLLSLLFSPQTLQGRKPQKVPRDVASRVPCRGKGRNLWSHAAGNGLSLGPWREAAAPRDLRLGRTPELAGAPAGVRAGRAAVGIHSPPAPTWNGLSPGGLGGAGLDGSWPPALSCSSDPGREPAAPAWGLCPCRAWGGQNSARGRSQSGLCGERLIPMAAGSPLRCPGSVKPPPASWPWILSHVVCVSLSYF